MRLPSGIILLALPVVALGSLMAHSKAAAGAQEMQATPVSAGGGPLRVNVDEVVVMFHATDAIGATVRGLKAGDIRVRDNGVAPRRVVAFDELVDRPVRVGILLDSSESDRQALASNKAIAQKFATSLLRIGKDEAFVSSFGYGSSVLQSWTGDPMKVMRGIASASERADARGGTALFNTIFRACAYSFEQADPEATGNFILLFSDGEDNAGLTSPDEAARSCQRSNTAVFAFLSGPAINRDSTGPQALRELASKTGGRVFRADESEEAIWLDLTEIESETRNQYRLVYDPADLKHDGAFHEIELQPPDRVSKVVVRSGYFAPRNSLYPGR